MPGAGEKRTAVIVAHGAGNDMDTPLITSFADGLCAAGYPALRFNFLYKEEGRSAPDRQEVLVSTWGAVFAHARQFLAGKVDLWVAAGKSMGGRVASQMAAEGLLRVDGLIFLGYPLHPANDTGRLRDSHLYEIDVPMLFFAGTRDPLCSLPLLKGVLERLRAPRELLTIEGGDHSFHVPKSLHRQEEDIFSEIAGKAVEWLGRMR
jgi:predicted alpha/beta-hydrolase family hydrolase